MDHQNSYLELGEYANDLIRIKAHRLIGKAGFTWSDCDDIEQELMLDLLVRLKRYDPRKSKKSTFSARIVDHCIATLIEKRNAACRDYRLCRDSLDAPEQDDEDEVPRIERLADPKATTSDDIVLVIDIRIALEALPDDLRELWDLLLLDSNISRTARKLGIPRTTLYGHLERLRKALREAGL